MKPKPSHANNSSPHDARIDAALEAYGRAVPAPGLESRIAARISAMPRQSLKPEGALRLLIFRRFSAAALAVAAACAIVVGTVRHSRHFALPESARRAHSGGVDTGEGSHVPTRATPQSLTIDPEAPRTPPHSRATITRNPGHRAAGAVVPQSPYPPDKQPTEPQQ